MNGVSTQYTRKALDFQYKNYIISVLGVPIPGKKNERLIIIKIQDDLLWFYVYACVRTCMP